MIDEDENKVLDILTNLNQSARPDISELSAEVERISSDLGLQAVYNLLMRAEVILGIRKPSLAIYDHSFHFIGGAQKYGLTLTSALQDLFDITILANKKVGYEDFESWYQLNLSKCDIKVIRLPYYEEKNIIHFDPAGISKEVENPFHLMSRESGNYDIFINNSMNEMVYPLSNISVLICHFPERRPKSYFYADQYNHVIYNSRYTAEWITKKWKFKPHFHIYPPVDMETPTSPTQKKKIILSVARYEVEGSKRQKEMIETFLKLNHIYPEIVKDWTFILAGGSNPDNRYLSQLKEIVGKIPEKNVELKVNISSQELKTLYQESTLFWHICGMAHDDPSEIEHFGMTIVEAMQNKMVPVVYDGGGPKEIVDHGINGFRAKTKAEFATYSIQLLKDKKLIQKLSESAFKKALTFSKKNFEERVETYFKDLLHTYTLK